MPAKKTYYGVSVGILMVKSTFRRYHGDVGNAQTFDFPVQYRIVEDAVPSRMTELHSSSLLEPFKKAADELIEAGVDGITTTCGFLSIYQRELADHCSVPVATSSLLQVPMVERMLPRLQEGKAFVAVGSGHLPGHEGILSLLTGHGYSVERVH